MPRLARLEIWSDLACNSGARLAFIPDYLPGPRDVQELQQPGSLVFGIRRESGAYTHLREQRVIRVTYTDDTFDEWRVAGLREVRDGNALTGVVSCVGILQDLQHGLIERTEADGLVTSDFGYNLSPSDHLTAILASARTYFAAGTVNPTTAVLLDYRGDSPLSALRELAKLAGAELAVRRNGTTNYLVDLVTKVGSSATAITLRVGRAVQGWTRDTNTDQHATRIYGKGGGEDLGRLTLAGNRWQITVAGLNVTLADPVSGQPGPIRFDDQLNGLYLREVGAGSSTQITDSVASTQVAVVASAAGLSNGDIVTIERNAAGDDLTYLEDPASKATYGLLTGLLERQDFPPVTNLVANPLLGGTYTAGVPSGWTKVGAPAAAEETGAAYARYGGKCCRIIAASDGLGLRCDTVTIAPTTDRPYFSGFIGCIVTSGKARVELVDSAGNVYPTGAQKASSNGELNIFKELGAAGLDLNAVPATSLYLRIVADGGAATFYVISGQATQTASQEEFYAGTGANSLWHAVNDALEERAVPGITIDVDVLDFARQDPTKWPDALIVLGGDVTVADVDTGLSVSTRILKVERDLELDLKTKVALSSLPEDLTDAATRPERRRRPATQQPVLEPAPQVEVHNATPFWRGDRLFVEWAGLDGVASVKVATSTLSQPAAGTGSLGAGQTGSFDAGTFAYGDTIYITVTPYSAATATGAQGPAFLFRTRLRQIDGEYDESTGKKKRTAQFSDGGYAVRAADTAGKEMFDDIWILSTKTAKVGTVASPSSIEKTLRIPFSALLPGADTTQYQVGSAGRYIANRATANISFDSIALLPPGVTITTFRHRAKWNGVVGSITTYLYKGDESGGAPTELASVAASSGAWETNSDTLSEVVSASSTYYIHVVFNDTTSGTDTQLWSWAELVYTMPSYDKGI